MPYMPNRQHAALLSLAFVAAGTSTHTQANTTVERFSSAGLLSTTSTSLTASTKQTAKLTAVGNAELNTELTVGKQTLALQGQSSFHLSASQEQLENGLVDVSALNIALFDVPQEALNWSSRTVAKGSLGFVVKSGQVLRYDAKSQSLSGKISGFVSADYMGQFAEPLGDAERDHNKAPRQPAQISITLQLNAPLTVATGDEPQSQKAQMEMTLDAPVFEKLSAYPLELRAKPVYEIDYIISFYFEAAKNLCVQPVRIAKWQWTWPYLSINYTGSGLAFGKPEAIKQWNKADVTFTWRPWKTVYKSQFHNFSTSEASDLLDEVNDSDCVETYFVNGDSGMHNNWGGGATFWSGEAYTKIISSDANATNGIDKVHLAHELGHAIDLPHPNSFNASSTNTLMCPSGFLNDNPAINSEENKDNLSNPLLTFSLKVKTAGPDCTDSVDCGPCP